MSTYYIIECARLTYPEGTTTCTGGRPDISDTLIGRLWESTYYADALDKAEAQIDAIMTDDNAAVFVLLSCWQHPEDISLITGKNSVRSDSLATETPIIYADRAYSVALSGTHTVCVTMQPWRLANLAGRTPVAGGNIQWTPRKIVYDKTTGAPLAEHRVNWSTADWTLSDAELARQHGVTRQAVAGARKRCARKE